MITKNEIKIALYKENPLAVFIKAENGVYQYMTSLSLGKFFFEIPKKEMFNEYEQPIMGEEESAKYLIRWLVYEEKKDNSQDASDSSTLSDLN